MLKTGQLPCDEPAKTWAGNGGGEYCAGCAEPIARSEIEYEVELRSGLTLRLHRACHDIWLEECEAALS
jgi:hypothetical protein